jgi:transposase InsO family protein
MRHIRTIIRDHPDYGYRRILPELQERSGETVNHKRLRRLLNKHELGLPRCLPKAKPSPVRKILKDASRQLNLVTDYFGTGQDPKPLEVFSTDFTELGYAEGTRNAQLMAMIDVGSRCVLGWAVGPSANRDLALRCWKRVRARMAGLG